MNTRLRIIAILTTVLAIVQLALSARCLLSAAALDPGAHVTTEIYHTLLAAHKVILLKIMPVASLWLLYVSVTIWIYAKKGRDK
jgi:hypothetical protein